MYVHTWGVGPPVVLVHGGVLGGREAFRAQRPLAARWRLLAPDRPGHGRSGPGRQDFLRESVLLADQLLVEPVHLVGHSYGAIVALYAAAVVPDQIRSLTVVEPPMAGVAAGNPTVDAFGAAVREVIEAVDVTPAVALQRFLTVVGAPATFTDPEHPTLIHGIRQLQGAVPPDEADPPLETLRMQRFPILVVTGGHAEAYEAIADVVAERTGGTRAVCRGAGHLVPDTGPPFNDLLEAFWNEAGR